ncbi:MAG TPA: DUF1080 domain-containing protein [Saprospiraceae bacterium]|nr:DUF1080 domain-containing protein [Saprospiraceae bacterium]
MRYFLPIIPLFLLMACEPTTTTDPNQEEWMDLFNGKDLSGWDIKIAGHEVNDNYKETVLVQDSMIRISYDQYDNFDEKYGHIYYQEPFSYYKIRFDYRFVGEQTEGGAVWNVRNSGLMFHSQSAASNEFGQHFPVSIELQLLGGLGEGERTTGNVCTPGTAVVMGDTINYQHCINSSSETYHGDQWVSAEAIVLGGEEMIFLIEGDTVLQFDKPQLTKGFINAQGGEDWSNFGFEDDIEAWQQRDGEVLTEGYIALQAESHPIDFKNIRLLNLCGCKDPQAKNYKAYFVKDAPESCIY